MSLLLKQYKELVKNPLPNVAVAPLEDNMNEWHVNFFFPADHVHFPSLILHFKMTFRASFPSTSPDVMLFTNMAHSHVHFPAICFSLLPDFREYFQATQTPRSAYWNPTRTVRSFLEDLYTFLLVDEDEERTITQTDSKEALNQARKFECSCGHKYTCPLPALTSTGAVEKDDNEHEEAAKEAGQSSLAQKYSPSMVEDLRCSITRVNFFDDDVVMGIGIFVKKLDRGRLSIETDLCPMSSAAFFLNNIRTSAEGMEITHFLPLAINQQHFSSPKTQRILDETINSITMSKNLSRVNATMLVLGELWKSKAVELMSGAAHASEKALKGFCAIHHLFLSCSQHDASLVETATSRVSAFANSPENSTKDKIPDLGQFLPLLLVSNVVWQGPERVGMAVVKELLLRNAMWIAKAQPKLAKPQPDSSFEIRKDRLALSWAPSETGLKLVTFQIRFILALQGWVDAFELCSPKEQASGGGEKGSASNENVTVGASAPANKATPADTRRSVLGMYDALGGRPTQQMMEQFQVECKKVQSILDFYAFFSAIQLGVPTQQQAVELLENAMTRSLELGYHKLGGGGGNWRRY